MESVPAGRLLPVLPVSQSSPAAVESDDALLLAVTSGFKSTRKRTRQRQLVAALAIAASLSFGMLIWKNQRDSRRDAFLKHADVAMASLHFDEAELGLSRAWILDHSASILDLYRQARSRRSLERPREIPLKPEDSILTVEDDNGAPYLEVHGGGSNQSVDL